MKLSNLIAGLLLVALPTASSLFIPNADDEGSITLEDEATRISDLATIFIGDTTLVTLDNINWNVADDANITNTTSNLMWETSVNGVLMDSGSIELPTNALDLPGSISAGSIVVDKSKSNTCTSSAMHLSSIIYLTIFYFTAPNSKHRTTLYRFGFNLFGIFPRCCHWRFG